jgi:hypothetical protein
MSNAARARKGSGRAMARPQILPPIEGASVLAQQINAEHAQVEQTAAAAVSRAAGIGDL